MSHTTERASEQEADRTARSDERAGRATAPRAPGVAGELLDLQQAAGNRAVRRLLQAKLLVGPADDPYEREADRVASLVVGGDAGHRHDDGLEDDDHAPLRRAADDLAGGFDAPGALGELVAEGGGAPAPDSLRRAFEPHFGDLSQVSLHTDDRSATMAAAIGARAFTHGSHIYFGAGQYEPASRAGKHLIAHELTHVVQQTGGARRAVARSLDGSLVPHRLAERRIQGDFFKKVGSTFKSLNDKRKQFFGRSDKEVREETGDENLDTMSKDELSTYMRRTKGGGPGENPDWSNPKLFAKEPDGFKVKLAVAQEDANWLKNTKALRNEGYKAIFSSQGRGALAGMDKEYLAQKALENQGALDGKNEGEIQQLVEQFTDGIYDVGHTWIRLETYVGGELKDLYSFGMWPAKIASLDSDDNYGGFAGPVSLGQGEIRHPDNVHEGDDMVAYYAHDASKKQFDKALGVAVTRYQSPPPYVLVGYNCTAFAREVFQAGGGTYPKNGTLLPGFAYTPGNLYKAIMDKVAEDDKRRDKGKKVRGKATTADEHEDIVDQAKSKQALLAEAGRFDVQSEIFAVPAPDARTTTVHLFGGNTIHYGLRPDFPEDSTLVLDKDRDMVAVENDEVFNRFDVYTFWMGPKRYWYVPDEDVDDATQEPQQQANHQQGPELPLYNGTGGGFHAPAADDTPNRTVDRTAFLADGYNIVGTEGEWVNIAGMRSGNFFWIKKTWFDYFTDPDTHPVPGDLA